MPPRSPFPMFASSSDSRVALLQGLMIGAIVVGTLYIAREVLLPLTLAILLSFVLTPLLLLLRKVKVPRVLAVVMLGDKPALTPAQSFYQRALTGDSAEATYQAELCLKEPTSAIWCGGRHSGATALQATADADAYATSLKEAARFCVDAARAHESPPSETPSKSDAVAKDAKAPAAKGEKPAKDEKAPARVA